MCLRKICERILLKRLICHNFTNILVGLPEKFGFMLSCSTTQHPLRLCKFIPSDKDTDCSTLAVFLDINEIYDSIWHTDLLYKLILLRLPGELIKVIDSYRAHRSLRVKMNGSVFEWKPMLACVPQECTLFTMLHNLYTSRIPKFIQTKLVVYADDISIYYQNISPWFAQLTLKNEGPEHRR